MSAQSGIEKKLATGLDVPHLEVINENGQHNLTAGSESHFKVVVMSTDLRGKSLVEQHRMIYRLLGEALENQVHALALHTYTEQSRLEKNAGAPRSLPCRGRKSGESG